MHDKHRQEGEEGGGEGGGGGEFGLLEGPSFSTRKPVYHCTALV